MLWHIWYVPHSGELFVDWLSHIWTDARYQNAMINSFNDSLHTLITWPLAIKWTQIMCHTTMSTKFILLTFFLVFRELLPQNVHPPTKYCTLWWCHREGIFADVNIDKTDINIMILRYRYLNEKTMFSGWSYGSNHCGSQAHISGAWRKLSLRWILERRHHVLLMFAMKILLCGLIWE